MALTARHRDGRRIDSTDADHWAEVHIAGYPDLACRGCAHSMHAVDSDGRRVRHFAHNPGRPDDCPVATAGESAEHERVKELVARAVREVPGWTAEIEWPGPRECYYEADVWATDGERRIIFEIQFSNIHASVAGERTRRHVADGAATVWLDARGLGSLRELRCARLYYEPSKQLVKIERLDPQGGWRAGRAPLAEFVRGICYGWMTYDGTRWATSGDRTELDRRIARRRELEALQRLRQAEQDRCRAAMQWPLRVRATAEELACARRERIERAAGIRRQAAMQWPLRVREVGRKRRRAEWAAAEELRIGELDRQRTELERRRAAWRADRDRFCTGLEDDTDGEVLERCARFAQEYRDRIAEGTARGWGRIGERLHEECAKRRILHGDPVG
jgi:hypothetical protein